jgi:hypothetical protein
MSARDPAAERVPCCFPRDALVFLDAEEDRSISESAQWKCPGGGCSGVRSNGNCQINIPIDQIPGRFHAVVLSLLRAPCQRDRLIETGMFNGGDGKG